MCKILDHPAMGVTRAGCFIRRMKPENMRMYLAAEALNVEIERLLPRAYVQKPKAAAHLENSGNSVQFNMGEGIGSFMPNVKINAYEIARKEANEVRAVLRRLVIGKVFTEEEIAKAYNIAGSIVGMLTAAIKSVECRRDRLSTRPPPA